MKWKLVILSIAVLLGFGSLVVWNTSVSEDRQSGKSATSEKVTVFKSPACGCCEDYAAYLERQGFTVEMVETDNMNRIKEKHHIPPQLGSCHTSLIGNYIVEGHVPVEAIHKLLAEKPSIAGIAMPGMPSGSPGMPGRKEEPFVIYSFDETGKTLGVFTEM
jgi:hypothetical protein